MDLPLMSPISFFAAVLIYNVCSWEWGRKRLTIKKEEIQWCPAVFMVEVPAVERRVWSTNTNSHRQKERKLRTDLLQAFVFLADNFCPNAVLRNIQTHFILPLMNTFLQLFKEVKNKIPSIWKCIRHFSTFYAHGVIEETMFCIIC